MCHAPDSEGGRPYQTPTHRSPGEHHGHVVPAHPRSDSDPRAPITPGHTRSLTSPVSSSERMDFHISHGRRSFRLSRWNLTPFDFAIASQSLRPWWSRRNAADGSGSTSYLRDSSSWVLVPSSRPVDPDPVTVSSPVIGVLIWWYPVERTTLPTRVGVHLDDNFGRDRRDNCRVSLSDYVWG